MARPREFEMDDALHRAMITFWENGYEEASLADLLDNMGLTRGSLYKAFGDKKSLFVQTLERYGDTIVAGALTMLCDPSIPDGRLRIAKLFRSVADTPNDGSPKGCLLCGTAAARVVNDPDISKVVHGQMGDLASGFEAALRDAEDLNTDCAEISSLAQTLLIQYVGLQVAARADMQPRALRNSVTCSMKTLLQLDIEDQP